MRKSLYERLERLISCLDTLAPAFGYKVGQLSIRVFEALRDLATQQMLFDKKVLEILTESPSLTQEEAEGQAAKWISPVKNNVPVHSTGAAVDIRLWDDLHSSCIDMGPFGAIWGKNDLAPTFADEATTTQKQNRLLLLLAASEAGLTNYPFEFWHFSYGDRYASFWHGEPVARYNSL